MQLTLKGFRARRLKVQRRLQEFERKRTYYIRLADNLAGSIETAAAEITKIDAAIAALAAFNTHVGEREPKPRGPRSKRNAALDGSIIFAVTAAGQEGIVAADLYDNLERAGVDLPKRKSFAVHLSYMGREGPITCRQWKWMLKELAPPLPPPAIEEAERLMKVRGAMSRAEMEEELKARAIPYTRKSLQTQLSERLRIGKLTVTDGRYTVDHDA